MTHPSASLTTIDTADLSGATGGGLFGAAWKAAKAAYGVAKPYVAGAAPFGVAAYKAHSIWGRATDDK